MKSLFALICWVACFGVCSAQSADEELFEKLIEGHVKSLETVLKAPDQYSALILYAGAGGAMKEKRTEDGAFLFYAAQLRAHFDKKCFPATGTGSESPFVLYGAFSHVLGSFINLEVMADPKVFAKVLVRVEKWSPKAPQEYEPGYAHEKRLSEKEALAAFKPDRAEYLATMKGLSQLLNDPEYFAAFQTIRAFNLAEEGKSPSKEEVDRATETMERMQKEKKLKRL